MASPKILQIILRANAQLAAAKQAIEQVGGQLPAALRKSVSGRRSSQAVMMRAILSQGLFMILPLEALTVSPIRAPSIGDQNRIRSWLLRDVWEKRELLWHKLMALRLASVHETFYGW